MANKFASALKKDKPSLAAVQDDGDIAHKPRPLRVGTKHIGGYFPPEVSKQLKQIAVEEDTTAQALLEEALDMLFHSRKKPTIASK